MQYLDTNNVVWLGNPRRSDFRSTVHGPKPAVREAAVVRMKSEGSEFCKYFAQKLINSLQII